jgi:hypothetical protein
MASHAGNAGSNPAGIILLRLQLRRTSHLALFSASHGKPANKKANRDQVGLFISN